jgi:DNA-binding transcriptional regulator YiaG
MRSKIHTYWGLGFPVQIENPKFKSIRGQLVLDINYNKLMKDVLIALSYKPVRLTGYEIKYIRHYFEMTIDAFANYLGISIYKIINAELKGDKISEVDMDIEQKIRKFIIANISDPPEFTPETWEQIRRKAEEWSNNFRKITESMEQLSEEDYRIRIR